MVVQDEMLDDEPIGLDADAGLTARLRRQRDESGGLHERIVIAACDS